MNKKTENHINNRKSEEMKYGHEIIPAPENGAVCAGKGNRIDGGTLQGVRHFDEHGKTGCGTAGKQGFH